MVITRFKHIYREAVKLASLKSQQPDNNHRKHLQMTSPPAESLPGGGSTAGTGCPPPPAGDTVASASFLLGELKLHISSGVGVVNSV